MAGRGQPGSPVDAWRSYKTDLTERADNPRRRRLRVLSPSPVTQRDLLIPQTRDRVKLLGACLVCGAGLAVLWVYFPLLIVSIMLDESFGAWEWAGMAGFGVIAGAVIFAYAAADERRYWESLLED